MRSTARGSGRSGRGYSLELCGGTHCSASGQIGGFVITGERSIGAGTRRIEAVTGDGADALLRERIDLLERIAQTVGTASVDAAPERVAALQEELREVRRRLKAGEAECPGPQTWPPRRRRWRRASSSSAHLGSFDSPEHGKVS